MAEDKSKMEVEMEDNTKNNGEPPSDLSPTSSNNEPQISSSEQSPTSSNDGQQIQIRKHAGRARGTLNWTADENAWLINELMKKATTTRLQANFPGVKKRSIGSLSNHITSLRKKGLIPRRWRDHYSAKIDGAPWTMDEDVEIMQWHVWSREFIDAKVFVANNRSGEAVRMRADYLCQDEELVSIIKAIEQAAREDTYELDTALEDGEPQDEIYEEMTGMEWLAERNIRQAIGESLASRTLDSESIA